MSKLILHVGPGKCGSSSIQNFFATQEKPCIQNIRYIRLNPSEVVKLNCEEPNESLLASFKKLLSTNLMERDAFILSHEVLFKNPYAIKNICSLAKNLATNIYIIGYSRRQSEFLVSSYSQWFFRSPDRVNEVKGVLDELELDLNLFTGLEKQIIASIVNDFHSARQLSDQSILDWHKSYQNILDHVHESGAEVKCGVLPTKNSDTPLIQDFCAKSELTLHDRIRNRNYKADNQSFNRDVVEAVNTAVNLELEVPSPHDSNEILFKLSSEMSPMKKKSYEFLSNLKAYIDTYYWESNRQLCRQYGLNQTYFKPSKIFSKREIIDAIAQEGQQRNLNKSDIIKRYQMLSARMVELCVKLAKNTSPIKLGIVILNWNAYATTHECILKIISWRMNHVIYIVDNGSSDNEAERLQADFRDCVVLQAGANLGYGGANNIGMKRAVEEGCSHILLLNNDATIPEESVELLIDVFDRDRSTVMVGPVIKDAIEGLVVNAGGRDVARYDITHSKVVKNRSHCYPVDYVSGTAALLKSDCIRENGYLDEDYFFSGEIADFCKRLKTTGGPSKTVICPQATAYHYPEMAGTHRHAVYNYYIVRNRYLYLKKYHRKRLDLFFLWIFRHLKYLWFSKYRYRDGGARWILAGLRDGLTGHFGPHPSVSG